MSARSSGRERSEAAPSLGTAPRVLALVGDHHERASGELAYALGVTIVPQPDLHSALDACPSVRPVDVVLIDADVVDPEVAMAALGPRLSPEPSWVVLAPAGVRVAHDVHVVRPPYGRRAVLVALMSAMIKARSAPRAASSSDGVRSGVRRRPD